MIPNVVTADVTIGTVSIDEKSFGIGLIVGATGYTDDARVKEFSTSDAVLEEFDSTDPEYLAAAAYFSQSPAPLKVKIGQKLIDDTNYTDTMAAIYAADNEFYAVVATTRVAAEQTLISNWTEANGARLFYVVTDDDKFKTENAATDTTTVWALTKENSRTIVLYHGNAATEFLDVAVMSKQIGYTPGDFTMKYKRVNGITADVLSDQEKTNILGKKGNTYTKVGGRNIVENGSTNTEWIDVINGADWIKAKIEERVYIQFLKNDKIPMTDGGVGIISGVVDGVLSEARDDNNIISPESYNDDDELVGGYIITTKPMSEVSDADKAARNYNYITFTGYLAGAIHFVKITGTLTY